MKNLSITPAFYPKKMSLPARHVLSSRLYDIHSRIFDGVEKEQFIRYVIEPATRTTKIYVIQNSALEDVGYLTFQKFEAKVDGRSRFIYRTEVGMLPAYRGNNTAIKILPWEITKAYIKSGFRKSYFLATPIHPNPYCVIYNHGLSVYPHPNRETPSSILSLMDQLSDALEIDRVGVHSRFEKKVGWIVREDPAKRAQISSRSDIASRFYLSQNPAYFKGNGMMLLVPIHLGQGIALLYGLVRRSLRRERGASVEAKIGGVAGNRWVKGTSTLAHPGS